MTRPRHRVAATIPGALVLAAAAALTWLPRASSWSIGAGAASALLAAFAGAWLGAVPVRPWVGPALGAALTSVALLCLHVAGLAPVPGEAPGPEVAATVRDACTLGAVSAGVSLGVAFLAARFRFARVLPPTALAVD